MNQNDIREPEEWAAIVRVKVNPDSEWNGEATYEQLLSSLTKQNPNGKVRFCRVENGRKLAVTYLD